MIEDLTELIINTRQALQEHDEDVDEEFMIDLLDMALLLHADSIRSQDGDAANSFVRGVNNSGFDSFMFISDSLVLFPSKINVKDLCHTFVTRINTSPSFTPPAEDDTRFQQ